MDPPDHPIVQDMRNHPSGHSGVLVVDHTVGDRPGRQPARGTARGTHGPTARDLPPPAICPAPVTHGWLSPAFAKTIILRFRQGRILHLSISVA